MVMRFGLNLMLLTLLVVLVVPLGLAAQEAPSQNLHSVQAAFAPGGLSADCLGRPGFPLRRLGLPPAIINRLCKPIAGGTQAPQPSHGLPKNDGSATYITFDVPGSACEAQFFRCTTPVAINPAGTVTGFYADSNEGWHGFLRASDGTFTLFDAPGADFTVPAGINPEGVVTGYYCDAIGCHGFLRATDGTLTTVDPPGSIGVIFVDGHNINPEGVMTGLYVEAGFVVHCFLRAPDGTITSFDVQGAPYGADPTGINARGAIVGVYGDADGNNHGFLRAPDGTSTTIDPPGSVYTNATAINPVGTIAGWYQDASLAIRGFLRAPDGTYTTFDGPGDYPGSFNPSINPAGVVTGTTGGIHGFLRAKNGNLMTFDPPGSVNTLAYDINPGGVITGWYIDPIFLGHGFIRIPHDE
jgi:hypothetical protein